MVLADKEIEKLSINQINPLITPFRDRQLQGASYDVTLSGRISFFKKDVGTIDLDSTDKIGIDNLYEEQMMGNDGYIIRPGEFVLAQLKETISIPETMIAHLRPKTRLTRSGLFLSDQHCNPTYSGQLYIGLFNASPNGLKIKKDIKIAQIVFECLSQKPEKLYREKENASYMNERFFQEAHSTPPKKQEDMPNLRSADLKREYAKILKDLKGN